MFNSTLEGNQIIHKRNINLGMATALSDGNLIVPLKTQTAGLVGFTKEQTWPRRPRRNAFAGGCSGRHLYGY